MALAKSALITSIEEMKPMIQDLSLREALDQIVKKLPKTATALDKNHVMELFRATHDCQQATVKEIEQLELLHKNIKMTAAADQYLSDVIRTLRTAKGTWKIDQKIEIVRAKLLWAKLSLGKSVNFGIKGTLSLNGTNQCETLERPLTGSKRCIANGTYTMRLRSKFSSVETDGIPKTSKNYTRIQVPDNQSERGGIQIHWGKDVSWSDGCTLVGKYKGDIWQGAESEAVYKALLKKIAGEKAYQPKDEAEWATVPRVKLVVTFSGNPS